jgi:hypothetical protein
MRRLPAFARCMRAHGVSDWPDPDDLGHFPLPSRLPARGKSAFATQEQACDKENPDPERRIDAVRG